MYVGAKTTPTRNQVYTCHIITKAKMLPIPAACQTCVDGRQSSVKIIVAEVATKLAGTKNAQMFTQ
jgi:hypothetical protein